MKANRKNGTLKNDTIQEDDTLIDQSDKSVGTSPVTW